MLLPPAPPSTFLEEHSEAIFVTDRFAPHPTGWSRIITFWYDGDAYTYALEAIHAGNESDAKRKLYGPTVEKDLRAVFLEQVRLNTSRLH